MPNRPTLSQVGPINQSYWKNYVLEGWCANFHREPSNGKPLLPAPGGTYGRRISRDTCYQCCMDEEECNQAVYESDGPWGTICWLGLNVMNIDTERPMHYYDVRGNRNRAGTLRHR